MFGFVLIAVITLCILVPCTYIRKAIQEKQTTKMKQQRRYTPRRNNRVHYDTMPDNEMTEEQMTAEDYYYYQDKE